MAEPVRTSARQPAGPPSILGPGSRFEGLVQLREPARIDGAIDGEIFATEPVWIGETGRIRARIEAPEIVIAGEFEGDIIASRRVELTATARVVGSVRSPRIVVAEGGCFDGRCETGDRHRRGSTGPQEPNSTRELP